MHGKPLEGVRLNRKRIVALIYRAVESFSLKHSDAIIAVDRTTKEFYQEHYPWLRAKIKVIPVGVDLNRFKPLNKDTLPQKHGFELGDKVIIYAGRLEREKTGTDKQGSNAESRYTWLSSRIVPILSIRHLT